MKTRTKVALTALCALLLVAASVLGTLAYLTSTTDVVTNTFTAGNVTITMDEAKTDEYGVVDAEADRVTANTIKLIPGHTYAKDPTIHVAQGSEECYVFVKIENEIADIETAIASQLTANKWAPVAGETNVYYNTEKKVADLTDIDVKVFEEITIKGDAAVSTYAGKTIKLTGYAVQTDNFDTAQDAWDATFGAPVNP